MTFSHHAVNVVTRESEGNAGFDGLLAVDLVCHTATSFALNSITANRLKVFMADVVILNIFVQARFLNRNHIRLSEPES